MAAKVRQRTLPERLDAKAAVDLLPSFIQALDDAPRRLEVKASGVGVAATSALQLLLSVQKTCDERGIEWRMQDVSDAFLSAEKLLGLNLSGKNKRAL